MTREAIISILEAAGGKPAGKNAFTAPDGLELTVLIETPGDLLAVAKVARVDLGEKFMATEGARGERHFFAYESILGFKTTDASGGKDRSAGFAR